MKRKTQRHTPKMKARTRATTASRKRVRAKAPANLPPSFPYDCDDPMVGERVSLRECRTVPGRNRRACETRTYKVIGCATPKKGRRAKQLALAKTGLRYAVPAKTVKRELARADRSRGRGDGWIDCDAEAWRGEHGFAQTAEFADACPQYVTEGDASFDGFPTRPNRGPLPSTRSRRRHGRTLRARRLAVPGDDPAIGRTVRGDDFSGRVVARSGGGNLLVGVRTESRAKVRSRLKRGSAPPRGSFDRALRAFEDAGSPDSFTYRV
jgi:hypothetical protein